MKRKANLWPLGTLTFLDGEWTLTSAMFEGHPGAEPSKVQAVNGKHGVSKPAAKPSKVQAINDKHVAKPGVELEAIRKSVATNVFPALNLKPWSTHMFPALNQARLRIDLD